MVRECTRIGMVHKGRYVTYCQRPAPSIGTARIRDRSRRTIRARERVVRSALVEPDLGPTPQFGVEQPVDDEARPFDPPYLAQRQAKIVLAGIGGELPQELAERDGSGGHDGAALRSTSGQSRISGRCARAAPLTRPRGAGRQSLLPPRD